MALCKNLIFAQSLRHLMLNISKSGSCRLISRSTRNASNAPEEDSYDGGDRKTHFGFETVTEQEKEEKVYHVFENVAENYDRMNDTMSVGVHRLWKDLFMHRLSPTPATQLLDVAGGTGDIAFRFLQYAESQSSSKPSSGENDNYDITIPPEIQSYGDQLPEYDDEQKKPLESIDNKSALTHVTVCDINQAMLDVGKKRAERTGIHSGISWLRGNAECLPVSDESYDAYTIAFGIRNCTHIDKVVEEAYRVLRPGGRFMCLEFSQVENPLLRGFYDWYSFQVIPVMGQVIAGDWRSYQYLVESIRQFPNQEDFADLIRSVGFRAVTYENLTNGVAAIHSGFKI